MRERERNFLEAQADDQGMVDHFSAIYINSLWNIF